MIRKLLVLILTASIYAQDQEPGEIDKPEEEKFTKALTDTKLRLETTQKEYDEADEDEEKKRAWCQARINYRLLEDTRIKTEKEEV